MTFFTRWDHKHYSVVYQEIRDECNEKFIHLLEKGKLPTTLQRQVGETSEMKPIFSKLNKQEHKAYLKLLQTYNNKVLTDPNAAERKDIQALACLQRRVVEEQKEFSSIFHTLPYVLKRYTTINPQASRFAQEHLEASLQWALSYPRHYKEKEILQFPDNAAVPQFDSNVLQMGKCARLVRPQLTDKCQVPLDYEKLVKRFPPLDVRTNNSIHPSFGRVSRDDIGIKLALKHQASVLIDLESLATLLDSQTEGCRWELPVVVRKDKATGQTVTCIDAAVLPEHLSHRNKNQLFYNYAARLRLTHVNIGRTKKGAVETDAATPKHGRGRPRKSDQPHKVIPITVEEDIFGEAEDLETFGVGIEPVISPKKTAEICGDKGNLTSGSQVKEEVHVKNDSAAEQTAVLTSAEKSSSAVGLQEGISQKLGLKSSPVSPQQGCTCAGRMMTRRLKRQCPLCNSKSPQKLDPPSTDDSIDDGGLALVIDTSPVKKSVVVDIASPDASPVSDSASREFKASTVTIALNKDENKDNAETWDTDDEGGALQIDLEQNSEDKSEGEIQVISEKVVETDSPESPPPADDVERDTACVEIDATATSPEQSGSGEVPPGLLWEEGTSVADAFPEGANVFYNLWHLGPVRLLLRHEAHAFTPVTKQTWTIFPKLEYNAQFGAEMFTEAELIKQMCYLIMIPSSSLLRVRVDALSSDILHMEDLVCADFANMVRTFSPDKLYGKLASVLEKMSHLDPGYYLLSCQASENHLRLLKATDGNRRGTFDLHFVANQRAAFMEEDSHEPPKAIPLDPEVVLRNAHRIGQVPLTFPPKDPKRPMLLVPKQILKRLKSEEVNEDIIAGNVAMRSSP